MDEPFPKSPSAAPPASELINYCETCMKSVCAHQAERNLNRLFLQREVTNYKAALEHLVYCHERGIKADVALDQARRTLANPRNPGKLPK